LREASNLPLTDADTLCDQYFRTSMVLGWDK
jgi:hypothetical protein